jgi:methionyl-tRNA formyltransferase
MPLRIVFFGSAELARASLRALLGSNQFEVVAVVTQPDRPKGRHLKLQAPPVKEIAVEAGLALLQPERARDPAFVSKVAALAPELIVVVAYGQLLPQSILTLPKLGCVNVHASLLPKYRGAAPIQWAIANDEPQTGVTIMKMDAGLDTGDILAQKATPIAPGETSAELHERLALLGAGLLVGTLPAFREGAIRPRPQDNAAAMYARKINREDGRIDWSQTAAAVRNRIRAFTPWPGAFVDLTIRGKARRVKLQRATVEPIQGAPGQVLQADRHGLVIACGSGALRIEQLQIEGGHELTAAEFLTGHPLAVRAFWK